MSIDSKSSILIGAFLSKLTGGLWFLWMKTYCKFICNNDNCRLRRNSIPMFLRFEI